VNKFTSFWLLPVSLLLCSNNLTWAAEPNLPIIGVTEIKAPVDDADWLRRVNTKSENFQAMLETQLTMVGRFKIIERNRIDEILSEQGLNNVVGDGMTASGGYNVGGVDYLVYGSITKFGQSKQVISTGSFNNVEVKTEMAVDLKLVDASSGEVKRAVTVAEAIKTGEGLATGKFSTATGQADPLADVQRVVAKRVAGVIATSIFPMEVIKAGDTVYINYGNAILDQGDTLKAFRLGEALIDEASGLNLGSEEEEIGILEVTAVTDKFSKAISKSGTPPAKGDRVRLLTKASSGTQANAQGGEKRGRVLN